MRRLKGQQIDQCGLGALDLGRDHGFLADEGVDEPIEGRDHRTCEIEPRQRVFGCTKPVAHPIVDGERGLAGWKRKRHERQYLLASSESAFISACNALHALLSRLLQARSRPGWGWKDTISFPNGFTRKEFFTNTTKESRDRY